MDAMYNEICDVLGDELERQENVLTQCRAQREALLNRDVAAIEARSAALQILFRDAVLAESRRIETVSRLIERLGIPRESATLTEIVRTAPEPWKGRLQHIQERLRATLRESRSLARDNAQAMRRSLRTIGRCLQSLRIETPLAAGHYTPAGQQLIAANQPAILLNQRG